MCIFFVEGDVLHFTPDLFGKPLIRRARGRDRPVLCLFEVAVLSSSYLSGEVWPAEDSSDLARRPVFILVVLWRGASVTDIVPEVSLSDEFFNLILEHDAFFRSVADISVESAVLVLIPLRAVSPHRIESFIHARVLRGQDYILTRPSQVGEVIVLARKGSRDPLIWALGLLLVGVWRSSVISTFSFLVVPVILGGLGFSCWRGLAWRFYQS